MKKLRQKTILDLITENIIDTQEDLQRFLEKRGFDVTQATVSRDIKELRIVKALDDNGIYRYTVNKRVNKTEDNVKYLEIFSHSTKSVDYALNTIVIKCHTGMAQGACAAFDELFRNGVLGTLAGDDTILVITRSEVVAKSLTRELTDIID